MDPVLKPIFVLDGVQPKHLSTILNFLYTGQVNFIFSDLNPSQNLFWGLYGLIDTHYPCFNCQNSLKNRLEVHENS